MQRRPLLQSFAAIGRHLDDHNFLSVRQHFVLWRGLLALGTIMPMEQYNLLAIGQVSVDKICDRKRLADPFVRFEHDEAVNRR